MMATVTVMRSRFLSTTVDPARRRRAPAEHVREPATLAAVHEDEEDQAQRGDDLNHDVNPRQRLHAPSGQAAGRLRTA